MESVGFKIFVKRLTGGRFVPRCRQTVTTQLEEKFARKKRELIKKKLKTVECICTTADCWSSRRKSSIGVTIHRLEQESLQRKGGCLAMRQLSGRLTYGMLAKTLENINMEFGLTDKICYVVTDSGANFFKAFHHFAQVDDETESEVQKYQKNNDNEEEDEDEDENEMDFTGINNLLVPTGEEVNEQVIYKFPPHRKCACHLLNLVATADVGKIDGLTKRTSTRTFAKLQGMWNKQNRSPNFAEEIKNKLCCLLITPCDTRWTTYDAVSKVNTILADATLATKMTSSVTNSYQNVYYQHTRPSSLNMWKLWHLYVVVWMFCWENSVCRENSVWD